MKDEVKTFASKVFASSIFSSSVTRAVVVCLWLSVCGIAAHVQTTVADRIVATVNAEAITYSDLLWQLALQPQTPLVRPRSEDLNQALVRIIDQRLVAQEAEKLPSIRPTDAETDTALAELINRFPSQTEFYARAQSVGLTPDALRDIVRARVAIAKFLDFRFRAFTVVTPGEVADNYRDVFAPRFRQQQPGQIVPTLEQARDKIQATLTEQKISADTDAFLQDARASADIVLLASL
jgi:hypothetical protein